MEVKTQERAVLTNLQQEDITEFELPTEGKAKSIVLHALISSQYENVLKACCREAIQNALDANLEAGREMEYITITLPTYEEPILSFEDCGLGIDQERFDKIYRKLGASTKRDNNDQMGGFGLGRLSCLGVASQVELTSVSGGYLYQHVMLIKDNGNPGFATYNVEETDKPSGTKVSIPIKGDDIYKVAEYIEELTRFITRPIKIKNQVEYRSKITEGTKFDPNALWITRESEVDGETYTWYLNPSKRYTRIGLVEPTDSTLGVTFIVGQLPYNLDAPILIDLDRSPDDRFIKVGHKSGNQINSNLVIRVPIGTLELTSNRENLSYNTENVSKIRRLLEVIQLEAERLCDERLLANTDFRQLLKDFFTWYPFKEFYHEGVEFTEDDRWSYNPSDTRVMLNCKRFSKSSISWGSGDKKPLIDRGISGRHRIEFEPLRHMIDLPWMIIPEGMSKNSARKRGGIHQSKHILTIPSIGDDPDDFIMSNPILSRMSDLVVVKYPQAKLEASTRRKTSSLSSLVKQRGARILDFKATDNNLHIYKRTVAITELPSSGVYIKADDAASLSMNIIPPSLKPEELFIVNGAIAEHLEKDDHWVEFTVFASAEFDKLYENYEPALNQIDHRIDIDWFKDDFCLGDVRGCFALFDILKVSQSKEENLKMLLANPREANWLRDICKTSFIDWQSEYGEDEQKKQRGRRRALINKDSWWRLSNQNCTHSSIPIFNWLEERYPMLKFLLRFYNDNRIYVDKNNRLIDEGVRPLMPEILNYIRERNEICNF